MTIRAAFEIAGQRVEPCSRATVALEIGKLYTHTDLELVAEVIHGRRDGPVLLVCAAIHGDELNGVEICRQLLKRQALQRLRGTLIIVPVVNIFGFLHHSRYLPDRRDLNRCFPGSERGSMGARFAHSFVREVLHKCSHVIDLHTGAVHRSNLPQVRANLDDPVVRRMAESFGAPVMLNAALRDGSLRGCADDAGIPLILYEAGEALRFNDYAIKAGLKGVINVMRDLQMLPPARHRKQTLCEEARSSSWVRAELDGTCRFIARLGQRVRASDPLAAIASPFSPREELLLAPWAGIVIGRNNIPLVNEGDALFHIARFDTLGEAARSVEAFRETLGDKDDAFDQTEALPD